MVNYCAAIGCSSVMKIRTRTKSFLSLTNNFQTVFDSSNKKDFVLVLISMTLEQTTLVLTN